MSEISLKEYAAIHGIQPSTARQRALRGAFKTARRVGRDWVIDSEEPMVDHRYSGSNDLEIKYCYFVNAELEGNLITIENVYGANAQEVVNSIRKAFPDYKILNVFKQDNTWK